MRPASVSGSQEGFSWGYQHVDIGDRRTIAGQEVLDPVPIEPTHDFDRRWRSAGLPDLTE